MKSLKNIILGISCASAIALTGCIDETLPTHQATDEQLSSSSRGTPLGYAGFCQ